MSQWMNLFLTNEIVNRTDKADKEGHLSVLSVRPLSVLDKKVENIAETGTDKADKPINEGPLSVLSVRPFDIFKDNFSPMMSMITMNDLPLLNMMEAKQLSMSIASLIWMLSCRS